MAAFSGREFVCICLLPALLLVLQGCGGDDAQRGCKISDAYSMIQVNGRSGLSQEQLDAAGVELCARFEPAERDTYGGGTCYKPQDVFPSGTLPDALEMEDKQPVLLVRCPGTQGDDKGQGLQRITCSTDIYFDKPDGPIRREPMLHINGKRLADNCLSEHTGWEQPTDLIKAEDANIGGESGSSTDYSNDDSASDSDGSSDSGSGDSGDSSSDSDDDDSGDDSDSGERSQGSSDDHGTDDRLSYPPADNAPSPASEPYEPYWVYEDRRRRTPNSVYIEEKEIASTAASARMAAHADAAEHHHRHAHHSHHAHHAGTGHHHRNERYEASNHDQRHYHAPVVRRESNYAAGHLHSQQKVFSASAPHTFSDRQQMGHFGPPRGLNPLQHGGQ